MGRIHRLSELTLMHRVRNSVDSREFQSLFFQSLFCRIKILTFLDFISMIDMWSLTARDRDHWLKCHSFEWWYPFCEILLPTISFLSLFSCVDNSEIPDGTTKHPSHKARETNQERVFFYEGWLVMWLVRELWDLNIVHFSWRSLSLSLTDSPRFITPSTVRVDVRMSPKASRSTPLTGRKLTTLISILRGWWMTFRLCLTRGNSG